MNRWLAAMILLTAFSTAVLAAGTQYVMRVDGLACPFCAYGIEKKLDAVDGVERIDVDLKQGLVTVDTAAGVTLSDSQMTQLFDDAGFTYRSMTSKALP